MQLQTADADATAALEVSSCLAMPGEESDAFEGCTMMCGDAQRSQVFARIRHQAFAAGLINRRPKGVGDDNIHTFSAQRDGGREACGTATDDECVTVHGPLVYHSNSNISEQNPGPIAARMLRDPGLGR
jgi:hypothetical protein